MDHPHQFWPTRRVLVTGCTGFLGTWVVRELVEHGADVTGLIRGRVPDSELIHGGLVRRIRVVRGRVEDLFRLRQTLAIHEINTVVHVAGPAEDVGDRDATAACWLDVVRTAVRATAPTAVVVAPVRDGHAAPMIAPTASRWPLTVLVPIPPRTPGPDAAHRLLAAAMTAVAGRPAAAAPQRFAA